MTTQYTYIRGRAGSKYEWIGSVEKQAITDVDIDAVGAKLEPTADGLEVLPEVLLAELELPENVTNQPKNVTSEPNPFINEQKDMTNVENDRL